MAGEKVGSSRLRKSWTVFIIGLLHPSPHKSIMGGIHKFQEDNAGS